MGLEPTTASLATRYSTTELHPQAVAHFFASNVYLQAVRVQEVLWNFLRGPPASPPKKGECGRVFTS